MDIMISYRNLNSILNTGINSCNTVNIPWIFSVSLKGFKSHTVRNRNAVTTHLSLTIFVFKSNGASKHSTKSNILSKYNLKEIIKIESKLVHNYFN